MEPQPQETLEERLREALESLTFPEQEIDVQSVSARNVVGIVTTPGFEEMNEAQRQEMVWEKLYEQLTEDDRSRVEFVFTNTPDEEAEMETEE